MAQVIKNAKVGTKAGRLKILSIDKIWAKNYRYKKIANCICDCGNKISIALWDFGNKKSCGCLRADELHWKSHTKVWRAWQTMKARCRNPKNPKYRIYGGAGRFFCKGLDNFKNFYQMIGDPPSKKHSLDREDNKGNYTCGECEECIKMGNKFNIRWATPSQQSNNVSTNILVTYRGNEMTLSNACKKANLPYKTIHRRIKYYNWSLEKSLSTPIDIKKRNKK